MPSEWIKCNGLPEIAQTYEKIDVSYGSEADPHSWCIYSVSPKEIVARASVTFWRPSAVSGNGPAPPAPPVGSGQEPAPDAASDCSPVDAEVAAEMVQEAGRVNLCKCIDCGGTETNHSDDCAYMEAFAKHFDVQETLNARGARYGDFTENACISQRIKRAMEISPGWNKLSNVQAETLTMIAQKIARILNGDPNYKDNWHDIQGYARLAEERCRGQKS